VSKYSPATHILREAVRIVQVTAVPPGTNQIRATEFWRLAALTMTYAKSDTDYAAKQLKELRWWARSVDGLPNSASQSLAARKYQILQSRG
jgi:hypothetical protein